MTSTVSKSVFVVNINFVRHHTIIDVYQTEFLTTLVVQAVDKSGCYKPVKGEAISPGDVVLLSNKYLKRYMYPMGRVVSVEVNSIGEVTKKSSKVTLKKQYIAM